MFLGTMGKYKVYVSRRIPRTGVELLKANGCDLTFWDSDEAIPHSELVKALSKDKYDAYLCMLTDQVDAAAMDAAGKDFFSNFTSLILRL